MVGSIRDRKFILFIISLDIPESIKPFLILTPQRIGRYDGLLDITINVLEQILLELIANHIGSVGVTKDFHVV